METFAIENVWRANLRDEQLRELAVVRPDMVRWSGSHIRALHEFADETNENGRNDRSGHFAFQSPSDRA